MWLLSSCISGYLPSGGRYVTRLAASSDVICPWRNRVESLHRRRTRHLHPLNRRCRKIDVRSGWIHCLADFHAGPLGKLLRKLRLAFRPLFELIIPLHQRLKDGNGIVNLLHLEKQGQCAKNRL